MGGWDAAAEELLRDGPWAAFCLLLLICCVLAVRSLLREARLNREAHIGTATVISRLATLHEKLDDPVEGVQRELGSVSAKLDRNADILARMVALLERERRS